MEFTILVPTYNNIDYLKILLFSLKKNSSFSHEIILHVNEGVDGTLDYVKNKNYKYTYSEKNIGLCSAINTAVKLSTKKYLLYAHDDMYFCPEWDLHLSNEVKKLNNDNFYLSGTMIEPNSGHIRFNCGENANDFNESKLLKNLEYLKFYDHQGSHFAPHLISKVNWDKVGGFSEEFNPGDGSDPDFNMKLWKLGVRIFKGINKFRVYHFSSVTIRKNKNINQNKGNITFLNKWGISHKFFKKHYLRSNTRFERELSEPNKNFFYYYDLMISKIKYFYVNL
jgi:glycosyltransferase involved in cell wall biosynthesis|tara:strand:- start:48 stop:890 length:843 start_codon:yes stop_codon:yes gene_type:complete